MTTQTKKPRLIRRLMLIILLVLLVAGVVGWFSVNSIAKSKIESQLVEAGFESSKVGSVRVGFGGLTVDDIVIEAQNGIELRLRELSVEQSIFALASGQTPMDAIVVSGAEISIDSQKLTGETSFSLADINLQQITLPANRIELKDSKVICFDDDGSVELTLNDAELFDSDGKFQLTGNATVLEGELSLSGNVDKESGELEFNFAGDQLHIVDQQWQKWPGIPPSVLKHLGADSKFDVTGMIGGDLKSGIKYFSDIDTKDSRLYIPKFDLPIAIRQANVRIQDGLVTYNNVIAALGDGDAVNATGTTTIGSLPCRSKFEGDFSNVDVADLRHLVKQIPLKVAGSATGKVTGSVDVNESLETTLRISAIGDTNDAAFGEIKADTGKVDVQIQPLVLTEEGQTIDLQGSVGVKATTKNQDVDGILGTFDLQELDRQFEFKMVGDGIVDLLIPLNSASDLRTWTLKVDSISKSGSVGGMNLQNLNLTTFLEGGQLVFQPVIARLASRPSANLDVFVKWPLPNQAVERIADRGVIKVQGNDVPADEAIKFFARQMSNAKVEYGLAPQVEALGNSGIDGSLGFTSSISLPSGNQRPIESWDVEATVFESVLEFPDAKVEQLGAGITIDEGVLRLTELNGQIAGGGGIKAGASLNLATSKASNVYLDAIRFPAAWLGRTVIKMDSSGEFASRTGLSRDNVAEKLGGFFNATVRMDESDETTAIWNANSKQITMFGKPLRDVSAAGKNETAFSIHTLKAKLPGGGTAAMEGDWAVGSDAGKFDLRWNDASLDSLLEYQLNLPSSFASLSDGELAVSFKDSQPIFSGRFDLIEPKAFGGTLPDKSFRVNTVDGRISFESIGSNRDKFALQGSFDMNRPFAFDLEGRTRSLPLGTAVFDKLSGFVTSNFKASGEATAWKIKTSGSAVVEGFGFQNAELSNIRSQWKLDTAGQDMELLIDGFGGRLELDTTTASRDDLVFDLSKLELAEFVAFRKLPIPLSGVITGRISIRDWKSPDTRTVSVSGNGKSVMLGDARLSAVEGNAMLTEGGKKLEYSLESQLLDGKLVCSGGTRLESISNPFTSTFPLKVRLTNARMRKFAESISSSAMKSLRQLEGRASLAIDWSVAPGEYPIATGKIVAEDVKWKNLLVSSKIYSDIDFDDGVMQLKNMSADLQQGEIAGRATIPLSGSASGSYQFDVRNFSVKRMVDVLLDDPMEASGLLDARISGRTGNTITGFGTLGISRAGFFGIANQNLKLPIRFRIDARQRTARIEVPRSRFRIFKGNANGSASIDIGSRVSLESNFELSSIDAHDLIQSATGYENRGDGILSGRLELSSRNLRTTDDLIGSFSGDLKQSHAFGFPLLDQFSRFLGSTTSFRNDQFDSDSIDLAMSKGRVNVRQFRLQSSIAAIAITGDAWLDGRLDMEVAARVERLNQPSLIDQLAGSPLARFAGPQAAFFTQAADFLSNRIVFLDVGGTAQRPQIRLNSGKQLKEETIRYFLRESQILPNGNAQNN